MPWGRPSKGGWAPTGADEPITTFSQVIRTILQVVPGGCIRYGKDGPADDAHTGFWLGVDATDNLAKFSIGGPTFWLKWTGVELLVRGRISTLAGDQGNEPVQWIGADGEPVATMFATDGGGHWLTLDVPRQDAAGDVNMMDLQVDGDFSANVRLRLVTERGAGKAGTKLAVQVGNADVLQIDGYGNIVALGKVTTQGVASVADAVGTEDAVNRRTGDGRYALTGHTHANAGVTDHGALTGLADDDHLQYLTDGRGDARYAPLGHTHPAGDAVTDHGALSGLTDDDHAQYHTDARGDARYLVRTAGVTKTITIGIGKTMTFTNGQLTGTTGL